MGIEIERKFKVATDLPFSLSDYPYHDIEQAYLSVSPVMRVRKEDENYYMTYKNGSGISKIEYNLPLTKESYEHLLEKHDGKVLTKRRYLIPYERYTVELDVFSGDYEGLRFAEVEFETLEDANAFVKPDWFTEDVSANPAYHNAKMALNDIVHE